MSDYQLPAVLSVLIASLLGSPHCAAMCGGFTTLAAGSSRSFTRVSAYHAGRLACYIVAGAGASSVATFLDPIWIGSALVLAGILTTVTARVVPGSVHRGMTVAYRRFISGVPRASALFPFAVGLASALLPCGWLYVYVGVAAAAPSPIATMGAFWLGTLPILTAWSAISSWVTTRVGRYFAPLRAALLIVAGIFSILQHTGTPGAEPTCGHHHHHRAE